MAHETNGKKKLLSGVQVLDFTQYLAGPSATRLLADLGADVVKIERAPDGDLGRKIHLVEPGISAFFLAASAGKKSVGVDFKHPKGLEVVRELVRQVDVVTENYSPGVMAKYDLDYASLKEINPRLIMCSVSGYGQDGPYTKHTSFDIIAQAQSGVMAMTGEPDGPPEYVGNYFGDPNAGIHGALAICAALFHRAMTGEGQYIDVSQLESLVYLDYINFPLFLMSHGAIEPKRFGGDFFNICPYGVYKAKKGYIVFAVAEHQWAPLVKAIGKPELATDPRYATQVARCQRRPEVRKYLEDWLQTFADDETPLKILAEARIPSAPILDIPQAAAHPQLKARGLFQDVPHPILGVTPIAKSPFHFSAAQVEIPFRAPFFGEHNEEILQGRLGYTPEQIAALYREGAIVQEAKVRELRETGQLSLERSA
ncbi:MAG TPA: CoA transferase [Candidatus Binatia bacterium]|nr:CoA transferase [Candidatus Binatia bacterium]